MHQLDKIRMGKFTAIGMRRKVDEENALVINTCGRNDTDEKGNFTSWVWSHDGWVYLRDHDTGRGIDRNGPMSHAWVLATFLNTGKWPRYSGSFK